MSNDNEQNVKPPKKKKKGDRRVKKQIKVVITDLETVIGEFGTVVSELRGVLSQIEKVTSHLDGSMKNGKRLPQDNLTVRETTLNPVPLTLASPDASPETTAKRRLESLISGTSENDVANSPKYYRKNTNGIQLCQNSKLKNSTLRWFTDSEFSFGSLSDVPSSVSTLSEILQNAGHIGSRESLASGSVYFSPTRNQDKGLQHSPSRSRHTSGGSDDLSSDFQANYNRDINTWATYAIVHADTASLASASDCWDSDVESLHSNYAQSSPRRRYHSPSHRLQSSARCQQFPAFRRIAPTQIQNIPVPTK